jgi:hypothetical protein
VGDARRIEGQALLGLGDTAGALVALREGAAALASGAGDAHASTRQARALLEAIEQRR